jgi:hypothetical protein
MVSLIDWIKVLLYQQIASQSIDEDITKLFPGVRLSAAYCQNLMVEYGINLPQAEQVIRLFAVLALTLSAR